MCRVGVLNAAGFEWEQHLPLALAEGVSVDFMRLVRWAPDMLGRGDGKEFDGEEYLEWIGRVRVAAGSWIWGLRDAQTDEEGMQVKTQIGTEVERLLLALQIADQSTRCVSVSDDLFARARRLFNVQEIVEVVGIIAAYNYVSRFLVALDVGECNEKPFLDPAEVHVEVKTGVDDED